MDNPALDLTKALTALIERDEKRFSGQQATQETHNKLLEEFEKRIESLETKCQQLTNENENLKKEIDSLRKHEVECVTKQTETSHSIEQMRASQEKLARSVDIMRTQFGSQDNFNAQVEEELRKINKKQNQIIEHITRKQQQQKATANASRFPVKSPSTSSFQSPPSNNNYYSLPISTYHNNSSPGFQNQLSYLSNDELDVVSNLTAQLKDRVDAMNRSFNNGSVHSND